MKFKGKSFIAIVLSPDLPFEDWFRELDRIIDRTPGFFIDRPIVLDMRGSNIAIEDLETLLAGLSERSIRVMGIDGVAGTRLKPGMPPSFSGGRLTSDVEVPEAPAMPSPSGATAAGGGKAEMKTDGAGKKTVKPAKTAVSGKTAKAGREDETDEKAAGSGTENPSCTQTGSKASGRTAPPARDGASILVTEHVRSGQSVMHPEGDVTVIGSVSSGAEIIAGGSIHIYGALRGRALAGVAGKDNARIFCSKLDAELVSINGLYKIADDFDASLRNAPAQIRFENETLVFEGLT